MFWISHGGQKGREVRKKYMAINTFSQVLTVIFQTITPYMAINTFSQLYIQTFYFAGGNHR